MGIRINTNLSKPIFQQIVDEIERLVVTGKLKSGDFIPSVRELSAKHQINPNTVSKAFRSLQFLGVVETVRGKGLRVKSFDLSLLEKKRKEEIQMKLVSFVEEAKSLGLNLEQVEASLKGIWMGRIS